MKNVIRLLGCLALTAGMLASDRAMAQGPEVPASSRDTSGSSVARRRAEMGIVKEIAVMPYATISYNLQSGQAFPKSAQGIGYGVGLAFDFAPKKQPLGLYIDFAYQDMRASSPDGACKIIHPEDKNDTVSVTVPVTHYFSYALFETFLKLQSAKTDGYFLIGFSTGVSTTSLTDVQGPGLDVFSDWSGSSFYNKFRFDVRAGLGFKLFTLGGHDLMFEARFGFPVTVIITDYHDVCTGSSAHGSWRDVSMQANIGVRL